MKPGTIAAQALSVEGSRVCSFTKTCYLMLRSCLVVVMVVTQNHLIWEAGPGQAAEVGLCEPHEVQQGQVQGPACVQPGWRVAREQP